MVNNGKVEPIKPKEVAEFIHGKIISREHTIDGDMVDGEFVRSHGLHWIIAALIIIGDIAGGSMVALPTALQQSGAFFGFIVCFLVALISTVAAIFLGDCWRILLRHWPEYHHKFTRKPYAEIGGHALGPYAKSISSISVNLSQFGIVVVLLLLPAKNIRDFLFVYVEDVPSNCIWILIVAVGIFPLTLLKSPEDFWFLIVASGMATATSVVLIIVGGFIDFEKCYPEVDQAPFNVVNLFIGLGTIVFAWGGHATFPTIQHDMRQPKDFGKSSIMAFTIVTIFYAIVILVGTLTYGNSIRDSLINSIQTPWIQQSVNVLISVHCILSSLIMINPINLEAEESLGISQNFGIQRVLVRGGMLSLITFAAVTIPNFGPVINLIGASTFTLTCIILPNLFYVFMKARENRLLETSKDDGPVGFKEMLRRNNKPTVIFCGLVIIAGIICGSIATGTAIREIASTKFEMPCYLRPFIKAEISDKITTSTNCCGAYQNITSIVYENAKTFCNAPDFDFYK